MFTEKCPHCPYSITTYVEESAGKALMREHILDVHPGIRQNERAFVDSITLEDSRFLRSCGIAPYL